MSDALTAKLRELLEGLTGRRPPQPPPGPDISSI
jgi:hypothetical protein